ncbi:MAG: SDR family NAD(P)-dependent oxidoreductase [Spirochaetota bacterium]
MKKKICLVTGGSSGVGKATALGVAELGASVIIVCRNRDRGMEAVEEIKKKTGNPDITLVLADLSHQDSIRKLVDEFKRKYSSLHVLLNCAGVILYKRELTRDGIERVFATDYLAHFFLTNLLVDLLKKSAPSRVITVGGNPLYIRNVSISLDDLQLERGYTWMRSARQAFAARVVFTYELARRLYGTGVTANAFHPGFIRTNIHRSLPWYMRLPLNLLKPLLSGSCETGVYLASSPEVEGITGRLFVRKRPIEFKPPWYTPEVGLRLWEISEKLAGLK